MAIVHMTMAPSRDAYEGVNKGLEADGGPAEPAGLIVHTAFELPSGEVKVVDVWETREALDAFGERIGAVFAQMGIPSDMGPEPEVYETFNLIRG